MSSLCSSRASGLAFLLRPFTVSKERDFPVNWVLLDLSMLNKFVQGRHFLMALLAAVQNRVAPGM